MDSSLNLKIGEDVNAKSVPTSPRAASVAPIGLKTSEEEAETI